MFSWKIICICASTARMWIVYEHWAFWRRSLPTHRFSCPPVRLFQLACWEVARRRQTSYDVARLLLMSPIDPWRNATPVFGAVAFCTTNIDDFRTHLTSSSSTISSTYSLQVDQLEENKHKFVRKVAKKIILLFFVSSANISFLH